MPILSRLVLACLPVVTLYATTAARGIQPGESPRLDRTMDVPVTLMVEGSSHPGSQVLLEARQQATMIYDAIGVSLVWTNEIGLDEDDAPVRFVAVVLSDARTDQFLRRTELPSSVLGVAPYETDRVYVFWDRIVRRARDYDVLPQIVLARVLAHEIGHHLLPLQGHTDSGIMRPSLDYRVGDPPTFTVAQRASIRQFLSDASSGD